MPSGDKTLERDIRTPDSRVFKRSPASAFTNFLQFIGTSTDRPKFEADAGKQVIRYRSATVAELHGIPFALASS